MFLSLRVYSIFWCSVLMSIQITAEWAVNKEKNKKITDVLSNLNWFEKTQQLLIWKFPFLSVLDLFFICHTFSNFYN